MTDRDAHRRARRERPWPVRVRPLGAEAREDAAGTLTAEERVALVWSLSARMWQLTGRPLPSYARAEMPISVVRRP